jgi:hypothetical protein
MGPGSALTLVRDDSGVCGYPVASIISIGVTVTSPPATFRVIS